MEQRGCEESRQAALQFRCKKILSDAGKSSDDGLKFDRSQDPGTSLASATPEKRIQPPGTKSREQISRNSSREAKDIPNAAEDTQPSAVNPKSIDSNVASALVVEPDLKSTGELLVDKVVKVPEKYKTIVEFFDRMECSVRMLRLKKKLSIFRNISTQVEVMTKRKFLYSHLAQIKYVFPEAVMVEKVLVHDKDSLCMVPDLKISLSLDVQQHLFQNHPASMALRQAFRSRLVNFDHAHPECSNIPEALLPGPFNQNDQAAVLHKESFAELSSEPCQPVFAGTDSLLCASHFPPAFSKYFSQKLVPEKQHTPLLAVPISLEPTCNNGEKLEETKFPFKRDCPITTTKSPLKSISGADCSKASLLYENTPAKCESTPCKLVVEMPALQTPKLSTANSPSTTSLLYENTPAKCDSAACKLVVETPALKTPKLPTVNSPSQESDIENEIQGRPSARKSLRFTPTKFVTSASDPVDRVTGQHNSILLTHHNMMAQENVIQEEETSENLATNMKMEGGGITGSTEDLIVNQTVSKHSKHKQMLATLPDLYNTIQVIFQSTKSCSMTKQELVHKILFYHYDIEETSEVEEQLQLLETLVPDWIRGKTASSGDFLYGIERSSDPESIRARIVEALLVYG